jgi:undecaprenyl phosphate-alpha-L-ara4FN deformylase
MIKTIGLRCDIDFGIDLLQGVPFLLKELRKRNIKITFFISMGPDSFKNCFKRINEKGYIARIKNFNPIKILKKFGFHYIASQYFKKNNFVGQAYPTIIKRIYSEGHEIGLHGYDHFWWAENIFTAKKDQILKDMENARNSIKKIINKKEFVWASPNWRCNKIVIEEIDNKNNIYGADFRGKEPFYPRFGNYISKTIQYPISLPCLHEIKNYISIKDNNSIKHEFFKNINKNYNLWCIHPYYEGILEKELFIKILDELISQKYRIVSICKLHKIWKNKNLKKKNTYKKKINGGRGLISFA